MSSKTVKSLLYGLVAALFFTSVCFLLIIIFSKMPAIRERSFSLTIRPIFKVQNIVLLGEFFCGVFVVFFLVKLIKPEMDNEIAD